jgi:hypothetical protein
LKPYLTPEICLKFTVTLTTLSTAEATCHPKINGIIIRRSDIDNYGDCYDCDVYDYGVYEDGVDYANCV